MGLIPSGQRELVRAVAALVDCNPFLPERIEIERRVLGSAFVPLATVWHAGGETVALNPNATALRHVVERLGTELRQRLVGGETARPGELAEYHRVVLYLLVLRYQDDWYNLIEPAEAARGPSDLAYPGDQQERSRERTPAVGPGKRVDWYRHFAQDVEHFYAPAPALREGSERIDAAHLFALGFQARRAFHHIFRQIFGGSQPAARLRATVWQSIFTHNGQRYREELYPRMAEIPTLITGESGTGKELVARAIALSGFLPFSPRTHTFAADPAAHFFAVNLSALTPTLIESELFGHRHGAFTGATQDRSGWLEACGPHGALFLDEIGELDTSIQVKLLRVLQTREFQRIGETTPRRVVGKVIAATNRTLEDEIAAQRFRKDFYYRICPDRIATPTLREQLADKPGDLHELLRIVARRVISVTAADSLAAEAEHWVCTHLGTDYPWPGNMRELEHCVLNVLLRGEYRPPRIPPAAGEARAARSGDATLTADEVVQRYCVAVYEQTGSYQETARRLRLDRRTVRAKTRAWTRRAGADEGAPTSHLQSAPGSDET